MGKRHETDKCKKRNYKNRVLPPEILEVVASESQGHHITSENSRSNFLRSKSNMPDSQVALPTTVQVHPSAISDQNKAHSHRSLNSAHYLDNDGQEDYRLNLTRSQHDSRIDTWDTASVASHNTIASDYLGSDSAFSGYAPNFGEELPGVQFGQARSYSAGNGYENTPTSTMSSPAGKFFESALSSAPNRKRASTLSP